MVNNEVIAPHQIDISHPITGPVSLDFLLDFNRKRGPLPGLPKRFLSRNIALGSEMG
jgi:hypothetical protein